MSDQKPNSKRETLPRREFLKGAAFSAGAVAVATAGAAPTEAEAECNKPKKDAGYRETEHVRTYYELAKL